MAKVPQSKDKKRRLAKKSAPLSSANKPAPKKTVKSRAKAVKTSVKTTKSPVKPIKKVKTVARTNKTKQRKTTSDKSTKISKPASKVAKRAKKNQQLISLPLGRGTKLVLAINRTKPASTKAKSRKKSKKTFSKTRELTASLFFIMFGLFGSLFFGMHAIASPAPGFTATVSQQVVAPPPAEKSLPRSQPTQLRIPDIAVDTPLTTVGLNQDGTIEVPAQYDTAGWYDQSPTPGEIGPSIIVGHLDNIHGVAVFWRLRELTPGQTIEVNRQDNSTAKFKVLKLAEFSQESFPTAEVYGNIKYAGLRLITCGGTFNRLTGHYDANIVVFAALVSPGSQQ